ncbi:polysaccharide biosynthesis protein [Sulfurirhabdus autotrophica]|uniref:FlaA1/EpsC-like NDP-sugar epimerase n=1 Tax=Sulfurirhabdus autotrophica TaxID=1706046 RepID=A0A4R3XYU3_9PROT|nr:nucleoside-diphosphate sugar epimerase/dehydratase [Sulfurirhabdus autotrophica]TCV84282.1 FlaA1/EpsC-like NDP-sugar epimerase [Sulfurirhabdus autotrophica]
MNIRGLLAFLHDVLASAAAWVVAYWLRFNLDIPPSYTQNMLQTLLYVVPVQAAVFWYFGLYRGIWRYASLPDIKRILIAVILATLLGSLTLMLFRASGQIPRTVFLLDPVLLVMLMGGSRLLYRAWKEHRLYGTFQLQGLPVLILGAGDAAANLIKALERSNEWRVVGVLDDNIHKHGRLVQGVPILGRLDELPLFATKLSVGQAIIAMPSASHAIRRRVVGLCTDAGIRVLTVPSFEDLMSGKVAVSQIRNVELDDLLGRDPVVLDDKQLHNFLTDKVVMVSGAGGSIGSELCRQIAKFNPKHLVLFELNEFALYTIEQEFLEKFPKISVISVVGDVKKRARVDQVIETHQPTVIFHAAAYKHVPLMERENAWEAMQNNILGTYCLASSAVQHGVEKFVLISTDKAVNPTNVMGASKRLAEMVCQGLQQKEQTKFVMVRFGNVLGSTGSVIPKFREQIANGGPITVTDPEITRYFMSIPEAAQLVLQAGSMGKGGEVFVMDMGEPVRIVELAKDMIRLSGFNEEDIKIVFTGLRPGEKLYEELLADDEHTLPTPHPKLRIAKAREADLKWLEKLVTYLSESPILKDEDVRRDLKEWVPEYSCSNGK